MNDLISKLKSPLFDGINPVDMKAMLHCIGYRISAFSKGDIIGFEGENLKHIGIILSGSVDMVKEDLWGNRLNIHLTRTCDNGVEETFATENSIFQALYRLYIHTTAFCHCRKIS